MDGNNQKIKNLFKKLDCYLMGDLKSLLEVETDNNCGGCGYPMFQTILSGIELMGRLLSKEKGREAFDHYIDNYLSEYKELKEILYKGNRHLTAHNYLANANIWVIKEDSREKHLKKNKRKLVIDVACLYEDFRGSYSKVKENISNNKEMQKIVLHNIKDIENDLRRKSKKIRNLEVEQMKGDIGSALTTCSGSDLTGSNTDSI